jgi:hypothetical protein
MLPPFWQVGRKNCLMKSANCVCNKTNAQEEEFAPMAKIAQSGHPEQGLHSYIDNEFSKQDWACLSKSRSFESKNIEFNFNFNFYCLHTSIALSQFCLYTYIHIRPRSSQRFHLKNRRSWVRIPSEFKVSGVWTLHCWCWWLNMHCYCEFWGQIHICMTDIKS